MHGKVIEGRNQQDGEGERNGGKTHLPGLESSSEREADDGGAEGVVCRQDKVRTELV